MSLAGSPKVSPWSEESCSAVPRISGLRHMSRTCSGPVSLCYGGRIISQTPTRRIWIGCSKRIPGCEPRGTLYQLYQLYQLYEAEDLDGANQALGRFADLYDSGQIPEYREIVDTIIAWGEEILAYHTTRRRVSNGPIEGINNLLQVLRRVAHGFTNPNNYAARGILVTLILVGCARRGRV